MNIKPLNRKNYGSIAHLPKSRMGPGDHSCHIGQQRIVLEKPRDKHDVISVTEKLDGCFTWRTPIETDIGSVRIGPLVNQKLPVKILTLNEDTGECEFKPIVAFHRQPRTEDWVHATLRIREKKGGSAIRTLVCTPTHNFYTLGQQWRPIIDLRAGDAVFMKSQRLGYESRQAILGCLLGDGSIHQPRSDILRSLVFSHSVKQSQYFDFKLRLFECFGIKEQKPHRGGYPGSSMIRRARLSSSPSLNDFILEFCETGGIKTISKAWTELLDPLALAIWYMDDGSCQFPLKQRPRAHLATNGFPENQVYLLSECLKSRFGIDNGVFDYRGPTIVLTADGTERFFSIVAPYIHKSMQYKLSPIYRGRPCILDHAIFPVTESISLTEIVAINNEKVGVWECPDEQFDISVAENTNYFAGKTLVHNSNVGIANVDGVIYALGRAGYPAQSSKYEQHQLFADWVRRREAFWREAIPNGHRLVGEWMAQAHGTRYSLPQGPFAAFDLMIEERRLPFGHLQQICDHYEIPRPKLLHVGGALSIEEALKLHGEGAHGADEIEGAVWRVERKGVFDFLVKFVRPDKIDGKYLPELSGQDPIWNWRP